jgi:hypothetical protein
MDPLSDQSTSDANQSLPFSAALPAVRSIARWLTGFFTLTDEERLAAGINLGSDGMADNVEGDEI